MPRKKLERKKNEVIQVAIEPDEKAAFDAWCMANSTTMSEVIRREIASYIVKGRKLLDDSKEPV
ncbi:hypothetical protein [Leptolyngbya sp. NIES-2104]|uniref:hypothetical protein n=1 Tax=Leptolyngbya sp. NIES-2104 TaxID=1552121 RepID=UPI00073EC6DC|nr:hypothetical protein [Leptolyngbya sp. NIES-2104]